MDERLQRARELIERPSESLNVELKRWIDPDLLEGQVKIVQALLALRNQNGGHLIIGFDNDSLEPDKANIPENVKTKFHPDKVQSLVTKYASEAFSIDIDFPERDGQAYPVITVPLGVKTPVASKSDLLIEGKPKIAVNDVYVRTLNSNNMVSTAKIPWKDWPRIMEICFDNRESDIGRFLRRQLNNLNPESIRSIIDQFLSSRSKPEPTIHERLQHYRKESEKRFLTAAAERKIDIPSGGSWEIVLILSGSIPEHSLDQKFLNLLTSSNPHYTGWAPWFIRHRPEQSEGPYVKTEAWEYIVPRLYDNNVDFMRFSSRGFFYFRRNLQEDMAVYEAVAKPLAAIDSFLAIMRTAEAIAVGIAFAKAMDCIPEQTSLTFLFRWTKLKDRHLISRRERIMDSMLASASHEDTCMSFVSVPLETPISAIDEYVYKVTQDLFRLFGGYTPAKDMVGDAIRETLEKRR